MIIHKSSPLRQQRGLALLAALVILVVMSLIAMGSIENSTIDERMATNTQNKARTFQGAETAISRALEDLTILNAAILLGSNPENPLILEPDMPESSQINAQAQVVFIEQNTTVDNYSVGTGFNSARFEVNGTGSLTNNANIQTTNRQGFYRIVPAAK